MVKVSIIIPVYNVEKYIRRCIDSVKKQTLKDIEIICVDDGSPDGCPAILDSCAQTDPRIKVIHQKNKGQGGARNTGVENACGEYITFLDSDDVMEPNFAEKMYLAATRHGADIASSGILKIRPKGTRGSSSYKEEICTDDPCEKFRLCNCPPDFYTTNKLYRREMLLREGLRYREKVFYEDVYFLTMALIQSGKFVTVPDTYYSYIIRGNSTTKGTQTPKKQHDKYLAHKEFISLCDKYGILVPRRYRNITKRFTALGPVTVWKVKENDRYTTYRLFDFIPVWKKAIRK